MKQLAALLSLAILTACAPVYTRTKPIEGSKSSALVNGTLDDPAQSELNKRAKESCGGRDTYEFYCKVPTDDGLVVYWTCDHPSIEPPCPPQ
jgi:hypothetical protein